MRCSADDGQRPRPAFCLRILHTSVAALQKETVECNTCSKVGAGVECRRIQAYVSPSSRHRGHGEPNIKSPPLLRDSQELDPWRNLDQLAKSVPDLRVVRLWGLFLDGGLPCPRPRLSGGWHLRRRPPVDVISAPFWHRASHAPATACTHAGSGAGGRPVHTWEEVAETYVWGEAHAMGLRASSADEERRELGSDRGELVCTRHVPLELMDVV
ncbi:hypothetical protein PHLGIDRAFT_200018 [Phlebiopsis gigantea 11061_1 CR5-6]|uniref:Uncharacterized protein n=1 Tax=Phlebiopsis gigantea (strain 11061_1 CR5-6) TaxID=745531 RepID=A0A0C3PFL0_PHLG1|nr:hypothetical protein PHLGIDRAFT_200018 [Phlebiopsis gigantea 11061_1 CR5-6]